MLPRSRTTAHASTRRVVRSNSASKSQIILKRNGSQKVLNARKKSKAKIATKRSNSPFFRVFLSGVLVLMVVGIFFFLKQNLSHQIDLTESYTMAILQTDQTVIMSLRGDEKSVAFMQLSDASALKYFPIDSVITVDHSYPLDDKAAFVDVFAPWKRERDSELSLLNRYKIWQYVLTTDSAHIQHIQSVTDHSGLLLSIQKYFIDTKVRSAAPTIAVVNTTEHNGLAKQLADILNAWGYSVIQVDSTDHDAFARSQLIVDESLIGSPAQKRLTSAFEGTEIVQDDAQLRDYRTQFVFFIGEDYQ